MKLLESHYSTVKRRATELKRVGFDLRQRRQIVSEADLSTTSIVDSLSPKTKEVARDIFSPDEKVRAKAVEHLSRFNDQRVPVLFRRMLFDPSEQVRANAVCSLGARGVPRDIKLIGAKTYDSSYLVRSIAIEILGGIQGPEQRLARRVLLHRLAEEGYAGNMETQTKKECIQALSIMSDSPTFALYFGGHSSHFMNEQTKVARRIQAKDGTSTVLLGGKLFQKVILRGGRQVYKGLHFGQGLNKDAIEAWKRAYEFNWALAGLDYNPIEPILKNEKGKYMIFKNNDGSFRAYAGVIPAFSGFAFMRKAQNEIYLHDKEFKTELATKSRKIRAVLRSIGVEHGHAHKYNQLVRVEDGKVRAYVIDFDQARIVKSLPAHN